MNTTDQIIAILDPLINAAMLHAANEDNEHHDAFVEAKEKAVAEFEALIRLHPTDLTQPE